MQVLRLHDPARRPANWTQIIEPRQFAAFARDQDTGLTCGADAQPFADPAAATCVVFDSLDEARQFCEEAVQAAPSVRFDVFDVDGRANPPLLTIVHPARASALETHPRALERRRRLAWALVAAGVLLLFAAYWLNDVGHAIFPGFIGLNMIIVALRILWFNLGVRETEREREARLAGASRREKHER